jgi:hypothetical protein
MKSKNAYHPSFEEDSGVQRNPFSLFPLCLLLWGDAA